MTSDEFVIIGEAAELQKLHDLMKEYGRKSNGNWVGHLVFSLAGEENVEFYTRGWWEEPMLDLEKGALSFHQESKWYPTIEAWDYIVSKFKSLRIFFSSTEGGFEVFVKRENPERRLFTDNYIVDICTGPGEERYEYFHDMDEALRFIERMTEDNILNAEMVEAKHLAMQEENPETWVYLHEFEEA